MNVQALMNPDVKYAGTDASVADVVAIMKKNDCELGYGQTVDTLKAIYERPDARNPALYSVVRPSKCSLSASAAARVWWTTPSR